MTINDYRDTDYDDDTLVSTLESQLNVYKEIDGLEIKLTAKDQIVRQEFIIDIENGDLKKLNEVGLIDLNGDGTVSFEKLTKNAKENKLTCKEK